MAQNLAGIPPRFLRTPEAARFLGLSGRTLEKHRTYGTGPAYRKLGGRVVYALGYTGLGVAASRWAGGVVRDMILRPAEDRLRLRLVNSPPIPFPPEPLRSLAVDVVRHELDRADRDGGRRSVILRTLDAMGIGFDS